MRIIKYYDRINKQYIDLEVTDEVAKFLLVNDDGSVRTYSGTRKIFDRFKKRNNLNKFDIHFHGLRHTFSNMLLK